MRTAMSTLVVAALLPLMLAAHPGHGEVSTMSGTVAAVEAKRIQLDVFDRASFSNKRIWVFVDDKTKIQDGKTRLQLADLKRGQPVDCMAETEEGTDGATALRAIQIRFRTAK